MKAKKLKIRAAKSNAWLPRRGAVAWFLSVGRRPADAAAGSVLRDAAQRLQRRHKYRRIKVSGEERFTDEPMKNKYSHPHDALQYAAMESGGIQALQSQGRTTPEPGLDRKRPGIPSRLTATHPKTEPRTSGFSFQESTRQLQSLKAKPA